MPAVDDFGLGKIYSVGREMCFELCLCDDQFDCITTHVDTMHLLQRVRVMVEEYIIKCVLYIQQLHQVLQT